MTRPKITVMAERRGAMSHAVSWLLTGLADLTTLTGKLSEGLSGPQRLRTRHAPGWLLVDLTVADADRTRMIPDIRVLVDQTELLGSVALDSTCWRVLEVIGKPQLAVSTRPELQPEEAAVAELTVSADQPDGTRIMRPEGPHPARNSRLWTNVTPWTSDLTERGVSCSRAHLLGKEHNSKCSVSAAVSMGLTGTAQWLELRSPSDNRSFESVGCYGKLLLYRPF